MKIKHSPSPWFIDKDQDGETDVVRDASGFALASPMHWVAAEHEGNLKLIAAAPKMYAGLRRLAKWIDGAESLPAASTDAVREKIRELLAAVGVALLTLSGCSITETRYAVEYRADATHPAEGVIVAGVSGGFSSVLR